MRLLGGIIVFMVALVEISFVDDYIHDVGYGIYQSSMSFTTITYMSSMIIFANKII